jgi:hypothetical protein
VESDGQADIMDQSQVPMLDARPDVPGLGAAGEKF